MAADSDQPLIAALDIGSSKVSALIVTRDADGRLRVLGTGQRESRGVKRGYVTDMEASEVAVREAVEIAERISRRHDRRCLGQLRRRRAGQRHRQCRGRAWRPPGRAVGHRRAACRRARARSTATARSCSTPIRRSTRSTGSRASSSRSGSMPTGWASTSMSSPPTRRRCATSIMSSARRIWA